MMRIHFSFIIKILTVCYQCLSLMITMMMMMITAHNDNDGTFNNQLIGQFSLI